MKEFEYTIKPPSQFSFNFKELWLYRELFYFFTWRDVKVKYKQTVLGFLWAVLQPLLMMVVFVLFFARGLNISTDDIPAPIFYFSGLMLWNLFSSGLNGAANSMVDNAQIIKKIYFPRLIIPFSSVLVAVFDFLMTILLFVILLVFYALTTSTIVWQASIFLLLPASLMLTIITTIGLGCTLAALNVKYRDFRYIVPFLIQFLLFVTPVIYPVSIFDRIAGLKYVLALNPMTGAIMLMRGIFQPTTIEWTIVGIGVVAAISLLVIGIYTFRKMEAYFADLA